MRCPFDNWETGIERGPEERSAHLTHAATYPFDRPTTVNDQCFSKSVVKADVTQVFAHGEGLARRHEQTMVLFRGSLDILHALRGRTIKIRGFRPNQLRDA